MIIRTEFKINFREPEKNSFISGPSKRERGGVKALVAGPLKK